MLVLIIICLLGLFVRCSWVLKADRGTLWLPDEYLYYVSAAENAFNGKGLSPEFNNCPELNHGGSLIPPPMQSIFLLAVYTIAGEITDPLIPRLVQAFLGGIMILLSAEIGRRLVSPISGIALALLVAVYPEFIFHTEILQTESNYIFGLVFFIYLLLLWSRDARPSRALLAALVLGAVTLQRGVTLLLGPPIGLYALMAFKRKQGRAAAMIFLLVPYCLVSLWFLRNLAVYAEPVWVSSQDGLALYVANNIKYDPISTPYAYDRLFLDPDYNILLPEIEHKYRRQDGKTYAANVQGTLTVSWYQYSQAYKKEAYKYIFNHPLHFTKNLLLKTYNQFWLLQYAPSRAAAFFTGYNAYRRLQRCLLFGGICGLAIALLWQRDRNHLLMLCLFLYFTLITAVFPLEIAGRYNLHLKLFLMIFASSGLGIMLSKMRLFPGTTRPS